MGFRDSAGWQVGHGELLNSGQLEVGPLDGRDALAKTMVFLVWNFTAANASLTRPSYDAYAYPPGRPTVLHAPPPQAKGECTEDSFLRMLPTRGESAVAVGFMHWRSERTTLAAPLLGPQVRAFEYPRTHTHIPHPANTTQHTECESMAGACRCHRLQGAT